MQVNHLFLASVSAGRVHFSSRRHFAGTTVQDDGPLREDWRQLEAAADLVGSDERGGERTAPSRCRKEEGDNEPSGFSQSAILLVPLKDLKASLLHPVGVDDTFSLQPQKQQLIVRSLWNSRTSVTWFRELAVVAGK